MTGSQPKPPAGRFSLSVALSVLLHIVVLGAVVFLVRQAPRFDQKRGEPLFVELPNLRGPAPKGNPAERAKRGARAPAIPPAPAVPARATPRPEPPIREMPAPESRVASVPRAEAPVTPPKERVAPVPHQEPRMARPETPAPAGEPEKADQLPQPGPRPAPPAPQAAKELPAPAPVPPPTPPPPKSDSNFAKTPAPAESGAPATAAAPGAPNPAPGEPGVAGDRLAALRPHPPGGGLVGGRGGIEGEPIPLDTKDPKFSDYFEQLRRAIQRKWIYPREAADKNIGGQLVLEFGIAKDGQLRFIELRQSSGVAVLDDYAMNAVKLASPFPRIPDAMSQSGIPVVAVFHYIIEGSLNKFLR